MGTQYSQQKLSYMRKNIYLVKEKTSLQDVWPIGLQHVRPPKRRKTHVFELCYEGVNAPPSPAHPLTPNDDSRIRRSSSCVVSSFGSVSLINVL